MSIAGIGQTPSTSAAEQARALPDQPGSNGFSHVLDQLLQRSQEPQMVADQAVRDLAMGKTDNLHNVLLAVSQADLTFRLMLEIRNRLTDAAQDIQRMQV